MGDLSVACKHCKRYEWVDSETSPKASYWYKEIATGKVVGSVDFKPGEGWHWTIWEPRGYSSGRSTRYYRWGVGDAKRALAYHINRRDKQEQNEPLPEDEPPKALPGLQEMIKKYDE